MIKLCNSCGRKDLLLLFSLLIILITSLLSTSLTNQHQTIAQTNDNNTFNLYKNPAYGIKIQYPSNWGRLDLSFLQDSADIDFNPLSDTSLS